MLLNASKPAILGGNKSVTLEQSEATRWPIITNEDVDAVTQVMLSGKLTKHPVVKKLEEDCQSYFNAKYVLSHCNGTMALLASFYSLNLTPGDEILVPSATFWASVVPMLWLGLVPVFCEIEEETLGIDPSDIEKKITSRTRAIVVTHVFGMPAKMEKIIAIANKHNLKLIEDASHAHGAKWKDKYCGTIGDVNAMSIMGSKLLPAGEGGILLTNDYQLFENVVCLGDISRIMELTTPAKRFAVTSFGMKTRISSMAAAIARVQLKHMEIRNHRRNENHIYLSHHLEALGFNTFLAKENYQRVYYEFNIHYQPDVDDLQAPWLVEALIAEGCNVSIPLFPVLHDQPLFTEGQYKKILRYEDEQGLPVYTAGDCKKTKKIISQLIKLPIFPSAERELLDQYKQAFEKVITHAAEIKAYFQNNLSISEQDKVYANIEALL